MILFESFRKVLKGIKRNNYKLGGVNIGRNFHNFGSIDVGHQHLVTIGDDVTIATGAKILAHDASTKTALGYSKIGCVNIGNEVFIGANAIILPNVTIGNKVIIGAGSVVCKDILDNCVVVGNPAVVISTYDDYIEKNRKMMKNVYIGTKKWRDMTEMDKNNQKEQLIQNGGIGFDL